MKKSMIILYLLVAMAVLLAGCARWVANPTVVSAVCGRYTAAKAAGQLGETHMLAQELFWAQGINPKTPLPCTVTSVADREAALKEQKDDEGALIRATEVYHKKIQQDGLCLEKNLIKALD